MPLNSCQSFRYRVYWEDTDAGGVVYHARYLHFFERARTDFLLALGFPQARLKEEAQRLFVVTRIQMDFIHPARLEDELVVDVSIEDMKKASMVFSQSIRRDKDNRMLNQAQVRVACVDANSFKPARLPDSLVAVIQQH